MKFAMTALGSKMKIMDLDFVGPKVFYKLFGAMMH